MALSTLFARSPVRKPKVYFSMLLIFGLLMTGGLTGCATEGESGLVTAAENSERPPAVADTPQLTFGVNFVQQQVQRAAGERGLPADTPVLGLMTPAGGTVTFYPPGAAEIPVELTPWPVVNVFVTAQLYGTPMKMTATYAYELSVRTRSGYRIENHTMVLSSDPPR
jgi:hypothetical protein